MAFQLGDTQQVLMTAVTTDGANNPTGTPTNPLTWTVADPSTLTLTPSADTFSCVGAAVGPLTASSNVVTVSDGTVSGTADIDVVITETTGISISFGTPEAK